MSVIKRFLEEETARRQWANLKPIEKHGKRLNSLYGITKKEIDYARNYLRERRKEEKK